MIFNKMRNRKHKFMITGGFVFVILTFTFFLCDLSTLSSATISEEEKGSGKFSRLKEFPLSGIVIEHEYDGLHKIFHFSYDWDDYTWASVEWDYGDGNTSKENFPWYIYNREGTYTVRLTAKATTGDVYQSRYFEVDAPEPLPYYPNKTTYMVLDRAGSVFAIPGKIEDIIANNVDNLPMFMLADCGEFKIYRARLEGYYNITVEAADNTTYDINCFVSPVASRHVDRIDRSWYRTQFNTVTSSNCGPSVVSMGISWSAGKEIPVHKVRDIMGWKNEGGVDFYEMQTILKQFGVDSKLRAVSSPEDIIQILDRGHLVGLLYDMAGVSMVENPEENLLGQYYVDDGGHYLAVKGYSVDKKYLVIYDPIPSDWYKNIGRYGDRISMYGKNRYYPVNELFPAMKIKIVLEIFD